MKTIIKDIKYLCLAICALCTTSCDIHDVEYDALPFDGEVLPRITGYTTQITNDWLYFNLRTGEIFNETAPNQDIKEGEQLGRDDWDIAFCGYHMRTNSGTSGSGLGGAIDLGFQEYEKWQSASQIPSNANWVTDVDDSIYITMSQKDWYTYLAQNGLDDADNPWFDPNSGPQRVLSSANPILAQAMTLSGPPMVYTPSYHVYAVRTADGNRIFKIQIVSWYNTNTEIDDTGGQMSYYIDELR